MSRKELANAIRFLSIDSVQYANSGHPGAPMGMSDIAEVLWRDYINHNPNNPTWINRDRFILSNGHCSILLYSILHLTGYNISINDLKNFRKLNSKTPGHPELNICLGIESTTGPLGQGLANAVGIALSEKLISEKFNRINYNIIDHYTYVFVGDGCLMEGISHEVCSLAGNLNLGKLIVLYDSNDISIDGNIKNWFNDNTYYRFKSYNWHIIQNINGHNSDEINNAINKAKKVLYKPSLLIFKTIIGFGSPNKSGTNEVHGSPLGEEEILKVRKNLGWKYLPFDIPEKIYKKWNACKLGKYKNDIWNKLFNSYKEKFPNLYNELIRINKKKLPENWKNKIYKIIKSIARNNFSISTRQASKNILEIYGRILPELIGGSADLTPSNLTKWSKSIPINNNFKLGNYINYGVREFGMTAISNGISIYGSLIPYIGTFLVFSDYAKNAIRMASIMKIRNIFIYTHDSIGLGEDGPTHQPIEQLSSLRLIPNMSTWRPFNELETAISWKYAIENKNGPTSIILSRQNIIQYENIKFDFKISDIEKGAYILKGKKYGNDIDIILIATGSEVSLAIKVYKNLTHDGYKVRLISMPSTDVFDNQNNKYKEYILPKNISNRLVIEAGITNFWYKYVGLSGKIIGIDNFGESASDIDLFKKFGFTVDKIYKEAKILLNHVF